MLVWVVPLLACMIAPSMALIGSHLPNLRFSSTRIWAGKGFGRKEATPVVERPAVVPVDDTPAPLPSLSTVGPAVEVISKESSFEEKYDSTQYGRSERQTREAQLDWKIAKLREEEALMATDPSVGAVPELVANRMLSRIVVLAGIPVFGGLAIFVGAFFYFKKYDIVVPPAMIAYATQAPFILGLMGITYGIMSSSWDKEDGSMLGIAEFRTNLDRVKDGLSRTKETEKLKDDIENESQRLRRK